MAHLPPDLRQIRIILDLRLTITASVTGGIDFFKGNPCTILCAVPCFLQCLYRFCPEARSALNLWMKTISPAIPGRRPRDHRHYHSRSICL